MRVHTHPLAGLGPPPPLSWVGAAWMPAVVPRLPAHLAEQAWGRQALQRGRGLVLPWPHGGAPAGGQDCAAPSGALAPGNRRGSALPWAARAAAPGWGRTGRARRGALGRPAGARALGRGPARSHGGGARQGPRAPQSPQGRAPAPAPRAAGGGRAAAHHHTRPRPPWAPADVLSRERARWQGARVVQHRHQGRRRPPLRRTQRARVAATGRARLVAWALPADTITPLHTLCRAAAPPRDGWCTVGWGAGGGWPHGGSRYRARGQQHASRRACRACVACGALAHGSGCLRTPQDARGWSNEPIQPLTDGTWWQKSFVMVSLGRDVKYAQMGITRCICHDSVRHNAQLHHQDTERARIPRSPRSCILYSGMMRTA
jgi:hypothetical protein